MGGFVVSASGFQPNIISGFNETLYLIKSIGMSSTYKYTRSESTSYFLETFGVVFSGT